MERDHNEQHDIIDLGKATEETKGAVRGLPDFIGQPQGQAGIADD